MIESSFIFSGIFLRGHRGQRTCLEFKLTQLAKQQASDIEAIAGQHAEDGCFFEKVLRTRMAFRLIGGYAEA